MLEIARQVFCKTTEAIHEHAAEMRDQHELDGLKAKYTARRGFYFEIHINTSGGGGNGTNGAERSSSLITENEEASRVGSGGGFQGGRKRGRGTTTIGTGGISSTSRLPSTFSVLGSNGRVVQCTTDELNALNARLRDATNDCLCLTEEALDGVSIDILEEHLPAIHRVIDGLALLDMLCGFARQLEMSGKNYVRPALTEDTGPLALVGCRHPVLEMSEGGSGGGSAVSFHFQENDTWLSVDSSLHVITGPNMAGKSTYLRQVAAAVVMAQVGCHVAASFASISPLDRILTRIGTSDSLETNSSSFMVEMQVERDRERERERELIYLCSYVIVLKINS
jgi:DNA mismatch repair protein MSH4